MNNKKYKYRRLTVKMGADLKGKNIMAAARAAGEAYKVWIELVAKYNSMLNKGSELPEYTITWDKRGKK